MRILFASVALATAALASGPAAAQSHNSGWNQRGPEHRGVAQLHRQLAQIEQRIQRSAQRRIISPREAFALRRQARDIRLDIARAGRNGLNGREFAQLNFRVDRLERQLRVERRDSDRRRG